MSEPSGLPACWPRPRRRKKSNSTATTPAAAPLLRLAAAGSLGVSGFLHAELYLHGYRAIPYIGRVFLLQAAGALAVAVLLLVAGPIILRLAAAGLAAGALVGFILSRTVGVLGFVERGLDPAPQALLSVLAEAATLVLLAIPPLVRNRGKDHR
jgi:hypothetical protein